MSYKNLKILFEEQSLINDISGILNWDMATYMPENSRRQRIKQITKLYDYKKNIFNVIKKNEFFNKVNEFELDKFDKINFELMKNKFDYFNSISVDKLKKKAELSIECEGLWREAKEKSNFNIVKNSFVKLVKSIKEESESLSQIKMRADRIGVKNDTIKFASITNASDIAVTINSKNKRCVLVIDSIQTMYLPQLDSSPGTVSQVRACAHELILAAKKTSSVSIVPIGIAYSQISPKIRSKACLCFGEPLLVNQNPKLTTKRFNEILNKKMQTAEKIALKNVGR